MRGKCRQLKAYRRHRLSQNQDQGTTKCQAFGNDRLSITQFVNTTAKKIIKSKPDYLIVFPELRTNCSLSLNVSLPNFVYASMNVGGG